MDRRLKNPKGSHVYSNDCGDFLMTLKGSNVCRKNQCVGYTTPMGSQPSPVIFFYKHQIPSGSFGETIEANIQKGLDETEKNSAMKSRSLHDYKIGDSGFQTTLKGSNVCRKNQCVGYTIPTGSHPSPAIFFYKHQIPSGLNLETIEADTQKGLAELKEFV
ncbi:MAG: hypothetical protein KBG17_07690 [Paludibacteraceae bacterium]|nr:hypothetical protein [Paludibacteraceae bacterium]